jgi:hypothetical protein
MGRAAISLLAYAMGVFFMTDVFSDHLDEQQSALVDPWSHQPQNWRDIPGHVVFAGHGTSTSESTPSMSRFFLHVMTTGTGCGR